MLTSIFALLSFFLSPLKDQRVVEDLKPQWKQLRSGRFVNYDGASSQTVFLSINLKRDKQSFLQIQAQSEFYLFINSRLTKVSSHLVLNADSLREKLGTQVFLGVYQQKGIDQLTTQWIVYTKPAPYDSPLRPTRSFNNFVLIALLALVGFFTALLRSNPQLTLDYLNIIKLFSLKRRDDSQFVLRITSSVNLLFYFFCSLLTSLALVVALHFSNQPFLYIPMNFENAGGYFLQWFFLSLVVAALLLLKLGLAYAISLLFGWKDTAGFQFFNFVRLLVLSLMMIGGISIFCFSVNIDVNYYFLIKCFCVMLSLGSVLMFFKLMNRESADTFHLFSYLCATEIFPLVILIKVFLF